MASKQRISVYQIISSELTALARPVLAWHSSSLHIDLAKPFWWLPLPVLHCIFLRTESVLHCGGILHCVIPCTPRNLIPPDSDARVSEMNIDEDDRPKLSEDGEKDLTRLWRTWKTVIEMLMDRV